MKAWILLNNGSVWDVVFNGKLARDLIEITYDTKIDPHLNIEHFPVGVTVSIDVDRDIITIMCKNITGE